MLNRLTFIMPRLAARKDFNSTKAMPKPCFPHLNKLIKCE